MADPPPPEQPRSRLGRLATPVEAVTKQVDRLADSVDVVSASLTRRAVSSVHHRRGGSYLAAVLEQVREGIVFMVRDWRLTLLQVPAAATVGYLLYRLRVYALGLREIAEASLGRYFLVVAIGIPLMFTIYTCSTVFTFALVSTDPHQRKAALGPAWDATRVRWRALAAWSVVTAVVITGIYFLARTFDRLGYALFAGLACGLLIMLIALVPVAVSAARPPRARRPRAAARAKASFLARITSASALLASLTLGVAELGRFIARFFGLRILGFVAVAIGSLLHMATSSSVRALKLATKLRPAEATTTQPGGVAGDGGGTGASASTPVA